MSDNIAVTPGAGSTIAADDIGGVLHQRVKIVIGADGVSNGDVSASNPVPVTGSVGVSNFPATQPVSGTFWQTTQPISGSVTVSSLPAVLGSVSVSNFPATQAVTGSFYQATQPVSIASMPSTPVTGTFWQATQPTSIAANVASSATLSNVANSVTSVSVLAANASRKGLIIHNDSTTTVYIAYAATASATAYTSRLTSNSEFFMPLPIYQGAISAISVAATGSLRVTEL